MAYDFICMSEEKTTIIPNEVIREYLEGGTLNLAEKVFVMARAGFQLIQKQSISGKIQHSQNLLCNVSDLLKEDEELKVKASRSVEGFICYGDRIFEEAIGQTFCIVLDEHTKRAIDSETINTIMENLFDLKTSGKLRVTTKTAAKILIILKDLTKQENLNLQTNKNFLTIIFNVLEHFIKKGLLFQLSEE